MPKICRFSIFLATCLVTQGVKLQTQSLETRRKTAHIYVVNLPERKDRCKCMQNQLVTTPFPTFLFEATSPETLQEHCPDVFEHHEENFNNKSGSVFCSNRRVLEAALKTSAKPDFIIIMEDDIVIKDSNLWTHVQNFLDSDCSEKDFDIIYVDTYLGYWNKTWSTIVTKPTPQLSFQCGPNLEYSISHGHYENTAKENQNAITENQNAIKKIAHKYAPQEEREVLKKIDQFVENLKHGTYEFYGAHLQVIPTSKLQKLLARKPHVLDHFALFAKDGINIKFWQPDLVDQASTGTDEGGPRTNPVAAGCAETVASTNNDWTTTQAHQTFLSDLSFRVFPC